MRYLHNCITFSYLTIFDTTNKIIMDILYENSIKKEPQLRVRALRLLTGAEDGTRTHDLLITNQLLYQLSHSSVCYMIIPITLH